MVFFLNDLFDQLKKCELVVNVQLRVICIETDVHFPSELLFPLLPMSCDLIG